MNEMAEVASSTRGVSHLPTSRLQAHVGGDASSTTEANHHTTWVCQATLRPDSELAGPQQAEEGHVSPTADGRKREVSSPTASCRPQKMNCVKTRTGRRSMSPLGSSLVCSPVENLQVSQARLHSARRGVRRQRPFWYFGTWNVRSLLDSEGSVETARPGYGLSPGN